MSGLEETRQEVGEDSQGERATAEISLIDKQAIVANALVGHKISGVQKCEYSWAFVFESSATLTAECPWRILKGEIAFTERDHGQQFGLPAPLDGEPEVIRLLTRQGGASLHKGRHR
jgi:hypothetical protein